MAKRQCVFISIDTHNNLVEHTQNKNPKVNIGSFVDTAIEDKIKMEKISIPDTTYPLMSEMQRKAMNVEEEVLMNVLSQLVKRELTVEDYKKCKMIYREGVFNKYEFAYDDIIVGTMERKWEGTKYIVEFIPKEMPSISNK